MKRYCVTIWIEGEPPIRIATTDTSSVAALRGVLGLLDPAARLRRAEVREVSS